MSAQDNMEKVLRELHVLLSKSNPYERDSNYLVVNKKEMLDILKQLAVCMSEVMDEYELTQQGREQAQRENRKIGEEIINDARAKAEDVYAASVMYTDEALRRILDIMDEANESVKAVYDSMGEKLANERKLVSGDKLELKSLLQDLKDTDKYICKIDDLDHFHQTVQLFLDLFKSNVIAHGTDRDSGRILLLCRTYGQTFQVIRFSCKQTRDFCENTNLIFYI